MQWERAQWDEDSSRCSALVYFIILSKLTLRVYDTDYSFRKKN